MKRTASSYGASLTLLEQLELERLETELDEWRRGGSAERRPPYGGAASHVPSSPFLYEG
jgi:hypothetical protein